MHRNKLLRRRLVTVSALVGCLSLVSLAATAQEIVHALAGTITSTNSAQKTINVKALDGSDNLLKDLTNSKTPIAFDRNVRTDAASAQEFQKSAERVLVYYIGDGDSRTVVGLRSLGSGPLNVSNGTVVRFGKKEHTLSIKDKSGTVESFTIASNAVAETSMGAEGNTGFDLSKGDSVRVTSATVNGNSTALFINTLVAN